MKYCGVGRFAALADDGFKCIQSLGLANDKYLPILVRVALVFAVLLAIGFIFIPVYLYLWGDPNALTNLPGGH